MALHLRQSWRAVRDRTTFPRTNFFIDFLQDLVTVAALNAAIRAFLWFGHWLNTKVPIGSVSEPHSYLPFDHIRVIVTVLYLVSTASILVSGVLTLIKVLWQAASEMRK